MKDPVVQAIDVHAHYGRCIDGGAKIVDEFMSADPLEVVERARRAGTILTVVSPMAALFPRFAGDPVSGNLDAARVVADSDDLLQWVVVDPRNPVTFEQAEEMLAAQRCVGIKMHPEEHGYHVKEHGRKIFEFAAENRAVIQTHSGEKNSMPQDFVEFADDFPEVNLILSHLGCGWDGDPTHQVRAIQAGQHGNIFTDTSSAKSIIPNLVEWAVREVGAEHVLYGTDSPVYFAPMQRARIEHADIKDADKRLILRENAVNLLRLREKGIL